MTEREEELQQVIKALEHTIDYLLQHTLPFANDELKVLGCSNIFDVERVVDGENLLMNEELPPLE